MIENMVVRTPTTTAMLGRKGENFWLTLGEGGGDIEEEEEEGEGVEISVALTVGVGEPPLSS